MGNERKPAKREPNPVTAASPLDEETAVALTRLVLDPTVQAAITINDYVVPKDDSLTLAGVVASLKEQVRATEDGDTKGAEAMLKVQAHTLDAIFHNLARRAVNSDYVLNLERFLKLALRAQSQCRATWEALATIKNPPLMGYVHQANIAHGPQQVNNAATAPHGAPRARENPNVKNKLLEEKDGERLDPGTACAPGRADPEMATVGEIDGAEDRGR
jgi:hypothetical protein